MYDSNLVSDTYTSKYNRRLVVTGAADADQLYVI